MTGALENHTHVHFVGIGGIGMSALARFLLERRFAVSGSDRQPGEQQEALARLGVPVRTDHLAENISDADLVVISSAIRDDNPEVVAARARGIPVIKRAELLARITNPRFGIAIAGTHGKTTTSALIGHVLTEAGLDPTILIGGISHDLGSNARVGESDIVVVEADEYDASFLQLRPAIGVVTNVEADHLDFYRTVRALHDAFQTFASSVKETLVTCADDPVLPDLVGGPEPNQHLTYGIQSGDWRASKIHDCAGTNTFLARKDARELTCRTSLAGTHNVLNILAAVAVADSLGIDSRVIESAIHSFSGVARRFERRGETRGVLVLDDYAHHPTEIRANLAAMKDRFGRPVRVVFQPHTFSRTRALLDDFARSFTDAHEVYLMDIYAARETDSLGISGETLAEAVRAYHPRVTYTRTAEDTITAVVADAQCGDLVATMGAGDVDDLGPAILERLASS